LSAATLAAIALASGGLLGTSFFGGLWYTVRHGLTAEYPAAWFAGSLVLRLGLILAGCYLLAPYGWRGLMLCLVGFLIARSAVTRCTRPAPRTRRAT